MSKARIFAVTGRPIMHSMSPDIHNPAYKSLGLEHVYIRLAAYDAKAALDTARQIGISGMNVTAPFKEDFLSLVSRLDNRPKKIRAVNTVSIKNNAVIGFNTDPDGVSGALKANGIAMKGKNAVILGAGGAAKAAAQALIENGANVTIANRTLEKARALARIFKCDSCRLGSAEFENAMHGASIVISTLSTGERVVEPALFSKNMAVLDAVYSGETAISKDARKAGCRVIGGRQWLVHQGVTAFRIFTGKKASAKAMEKSAKPRRHERKRNIALIGFMGSGKSLAAKEIAKMTGMKIIETDREIEKSAGMSINGIFAKQGEQGFRKIESGEVKKAAKAKNAVISLGGGAVLDRKNVDAIRRSSCVIWLWASPKETLDRVSREKHRPLLNVKNKEARIKSMLGARIPKYAGSCDLAIGTDGLSPGKIARLIIDETGIAWRN